MNDMAHKRRTRPVAAAALTATSSEDTELILKIVNRFIDLTEAATRDTINIVLDMTLAHSTAGLDLEGLAAGRDHDIIHDVGGIVANLYRVTGHLENCWSPRYLRHVERPAQPSKPYVVVAQNRAGAVISTTGFNDRAPALEASTKAAIDGAYESSVYSRIAIDSGREVSSKE
jgi:hypothetical protein